MMELSSNLTALWTLLHKVQNIGCHMQGVCCGSSTSTQGDVFANRTLGSVLGVTSLGDVFANQTRALTDLYQT